LAETPGFKLRCFCIAADLQSVCSDTNATEWLFLKAIDPLPSNENVILLTKIELHASHIHSGASNQECWKSTGGFFRRQEDLRQGKNGEDRSASG
jgi:hypothetical protein